MKPSAKKIVHSITAFTLLDYPDQTACILWFAGCNMKCSYCYNPEIVFGKGNYSIPELLSFLEKRRGLLDAVVFSGGECLLYKESIELMFLIKAMGFLIKVDTNGSKPERLQEAIDLGLIDYVALDFKATRAKFKSITESRFYEQFLECLSILQLSKTPFEVRTTVHTDLLNENDIVQMTQLLEDKDYNGNYFLQPYRNNSITLKPLNTSKNFDYTHLSTHNIRLCMR
ncbi:anaerobic ribonucleoside-triphosphate reductase activating protein [Flavobacterium piscinae]|uniref:Anaerobic ribonucleoside-triphosphate reductase activating protein n=1 Tax=Flavobacterium piscinae TaxID=2506424 RepID=A0A4Q1KMT0_9FLAO|nr:anaerobic ribonucleoside-triphosphate reductase activating protein [Flavobacterium piscinae]RXR31311.1 anaerobic ribonucleoside-triphosphate reductase activating protein [Flavobacterium piscinae]